MSSADDGPQAFIQYRPGLLLRSKIFAKNKIHPENMTIKLLALAVVLDNKGNLLFKTSDYTKTDDMMLFLE